jgi:DNA polymerase-3 subunit beta
MDDITNDEKRLAEIAAAAPPKKKRAKKEAAAEAAPAGPMTLPSPTAVVLDAVKLADAFALVRRATGKGLPILSCVLLRITEGSAAMQLVCTNLDMRASIWVTMMGGAMGRAAAIAVSAAALAKLLGEVEASEVLLDIWPNKLVVRAGKWRAELCGLGADEFPPNPRPEGNDGVHPVEVADGVLKNMLRVTAGAVSRDETRYVLNGVMLRFAENELVLAVGTDGRRLAAVSWPDKMIGVEARWQVILPTAAVRLLVGALSDGEEVGRLNAHRKDAPGADGVPQVFAISLVTGGSGLELWTKVIEGEYPKYNQAIPGRTLEPVAVDGKALVEMCARGAALEPKGVDIMAEGRAVTVRAAAPDVGVWEETSEMISADDMMEDKFEIRVNPEYASVLGVGEQGRLDVGHARDMGPLVWRANITAGGRGLHYVGVVMPLRNEGGAA